MGRVAEVLPQSLTGALDDLLDHITFSIAFEVIHVLIELPQRIKPLRLHPLVEGSGIAGADDEARGNSLVVYGSKTQLRLEEEVRGCVVVTNCPWIVIVRSSIQADERRLKCYVIKIRKILSNCITYQSHVGVSPFSNTTGI